MSLDLFSLFLGLLVSLLLLIPAIIFFKRRSDAFENQIKEALLREQELSKVLAVNQQRADELTQRLQDFESTQKQLEQTTIQLEVSREQNLSKTRTIESQEAQIRDLKEQLETYRKQSTDFETALELERSTNTGLKSRLDEQKQELLDLQKQFRSEFEVLASKILEDKSKRFTQQNQEKLDLLLKPLGQQINDFKKRVDEVYEQESKQRVSLQTEVKLLIEQTQQVSSQADKLAQALKSDKKMQGNWGEMILERMLEDAGLADERILEKQPTYRDASGNMLRPDVVINYPDARKIVVDSKVSLNDYHEFIQADDEQVRADALKRHVLAVRRHIDSLAEKNYAKAVGGLDFVMLFMPIEPAYLAALHAQNDLWGYAYRKGIMLIGPSNLLVTLKILQDLWTRNDQSLNAQKIADQAGKLLVKFVNFAEDMEKIDMRLRQSREAYDDAFKKLASGRGNMTLMVSKIEKLGAKDKKGVNDLPSSWKDQANLLSSAEELEESPAQHQEVKNVD